MVRWISVAAAALLSGCVDRYIPVAATTSSMVSSIEAAKEACRQQLAAAGDLDAFLLGPLAGVRSGAAQGATTGALAGGAAQGAAIGAAAGLVVGAVAGAIGETGEARATMDRCMTAHGYQRS